MMERRNFITSICAVIAFPFLWFRVKPKPKEENKGPLPIINLGEKPRDIVHFPSDMLCCFGGDEKYYTGSMHIKSSSHIPAIYNFKEGGLISMNVGSWDNLPFNYEGIWGCDPRYIIGIYGDKFDGEISVGYKEGNVNCQIIYKFIKGLLESITYKCK